jgi:hypothetical protein
VDEKRLDADLTRRRNFDVRCADLEAVARAGIVTFLLPSSSQRPAPNSPLSINPLRLERSVIWSLCSPRCSKAGDINRGELGKEVNWGLCDSLPSSVVPRRETRSKFCGAGPSGDAGVISVTGGAVSPIVNGTSQAQVDSDRRSKYSDESNRGGVPCLIHCLSYLINY